MEFDLNRDQAAAFLATKIPHCTRMTLAMLAHKGDGPKMKYLGRKPYYCRNDLQAWVQTQISEVTTSTKDRICKAKR